MGWEDSPGGGRGNPLQYSSLENPWTEEPGGLQSTGHKESETTEQLSSIQLTGHKQHHHPGELVRNANCETIPDLQHQILYCNKNVDCYAQSKLESIDLESTIEWVN